MMFPPPWLVMAGFALVTPCFAFWDNAVDAVANTIVELATQDIFQDIAKFVSTGQLCAVTSFVRCCTDNDDKPSCEESSYPTADQQRRMALQHHISNDAPFYETTWIGTHNSYNAERYGYPYPQQSGSISDQLRAGLRILSLDIHQKLDDLNKVILCHDGVVNSISCSSNDLELRNALSEIKGFLVNNQKEVVLVIIEDRLGTRVRGARGNAVLDIMKLFGDIVYKPQDLGHDGRGCRTLPADDDTLTKASLLKAGKQVIFATSGEDLVSYSCCTCQDQNNQFRKWIWTVETAEYSGGTPPIYGKMAKSKTLIFKAEDRLIQNKIIRSDDGGRDARTILENGVHGIGLDWYGRVNRFDDLIWSWAARQPDCDPLWPACCALQKTDGKWKAANCTENHKYACRDETTGAWSTAMASSTGLRGWEKCDQQGQKHALPVNANYNKQLRDAAGGAEEVWLPYYYNHSLGGWSLLTSRPECGGRNQPACCLPWEGSTECRPRLTLDVVGEPTCFSDPSRHSHGTCVLLQCGGDGESACCPAEAITKGLVRSEDAVSSVQTAYCDAGLKHVPASVGDTIKNCQIRRSSGSPVLDQANVNGTCVRCGGAGERACLVPTEFSQECEDGFVKSQVGCVVPTCGRFLDRSCCAGERDDDQECVGDDLVVSVPENITSLQDCEKLNEDGTVNKTRGVCRFAPPTAMPSISNMPSTLPSGSPITPLTPPLN